MLAHTLGNPFDLQAVKDFCASNNLWLIEDNNIQTRMLFAGNLVRHPCFDELRKSSTGYRVIGNLEVTDRVMNDTFWVGVYPGMNGEMVDRMINVIRSGTVRKNDKSGV